MRSLEAITATLVKLMKTEPEPGCRRPYGTATGYCNSVVQLTCCRPPSCNCPALVDSLVQSKQISAKQVVFRSPVKVVRSRLQTTFALTTVKVVLTAVNAKVVCSRLQTTFALTAVNATIVHSRLQTIVALTAGVHDRNRVPVACRHGTCILACAKTPRPSLLVCGHTLRRGRCVFPAHAC